MYDQRNRVDPRILRKVMVVVEDLLAKYKRSDWMYALGLSLEEPHYLDAAYNKLVAQGKAKMWEGKHRWPLLVTLDVMELPPKPSEEEVYGEQFDHFGE